MGSEMCIRDRNKSVVLVFEAYRAQIRFKRRIRSTAWCSRQATHRLGRVKQIDCLFASCIEYDAQRAVLLPEAYKDPICFECRIQPVTCGSRPSTHQFGCVKQIGNLFASCIKCNTQSVALVPEAYQEPICFKHRT